MSDPLPASLGTLLCEAMSQQKLTIVEVHRRSSLSTKHIWALRNDRVRRLTIETAQKLEKATGITAVAWITADAAHRDAVSQRRKRRLSKPGGA